MSTLSTSITLLKRVQQVDDQAAWKRLVDLYTPLLFRWAQRAGLSGDDARDVVQEVLVVLVKELPTFEYDPGRGSFRGWLKAVTRNRCLEKFRDRLIADPLSDLAQAVNETDALDDFWDREYQRMLVERAAELLREEFEPQTWQAYWEYAVKGRPVTEVAEELGVTNNVVYLAKHRVIRRLREELAGLYE
jgi:RNA polymerase sigma-70 factor, ECF subfamily